MDTANALLDIQWVPWQIEIEQHTGKLKIDALAAGSGAHEHPRPILLSKPAFRSELGAVIATF